MGKNVGDIDRILRIGIGLILIVMELGGISPISPWGWIGVVPLVTGLIGWCPPYAILGISTCKSKSS
jgi:hypothetical protein